MIFKRRIQDVPNGPTTFVAPSTTIAGTITGQGPYVFCGSVEGDCDINGPVTLAEGGRWKGTLKGTDVVLAGEAAAAPLAGDLGEHRAVDPARESVALEERAVAAVREHLDLERARRCE